mmetsp:Transcript_23780/g.26689  ORF Transcript_23780/g.26689 Transcript_23780/m.26689 type:complete len:105 (-) Transcript_23780:504-818(-)
MLVDNDSRSFGTLSAMSVYAAGVANAQKSPMTILHDNTSVYVVDRAVPTVATDHPTVDNTISNLRSYRSAATPAPKEATAKRAVNANEASSPYCNSVNPIATFI